MDDIRMMLLSCGPEFLMADERREVVLIMAVWMTGMGSLSWCGSGDGMRTIA
jgi:hypothetical protein